MNIKYKIVKLILKYKNDRIEKMVNNLPESDRIMHSIIKTLINNEKSDLKYAMLSNIRFIINKTQKIFIMIENSDISLVDETGDGHPYNMSLPDIIYNDIRKRFDRRAEYLRISYRNNVLRKNKTNLQTINNKINE